VKKVSILILSCIFWWAQWETEAGESEKEMEAEIGVIWRRDHEPRDAGGLQELEKKETILL
jgi:hypothetical protein